MTTQNVDYSEIKPIHFASCLADKTKLNWFSFELASELDSATPAQLKKVLARKGYTKQMFNLSCIKLAKLLQKTILRKLRNEIPEMELNYQDVEAAFPRLNDVLIAQLLKHVATAWDRLLGSCVTCPTACITNKDEYCPLFDEDDW